VSSRLRLLIVIALVIVVVGAGAALILPRLTQPAGGGSTAPTAVANRPDTSQPAATALPTPTELATIPIIVAVQNINRGQVISSDLVDIRQWPAIYAPQTAITNPEDVIGKIARVDIFREQPILFSLVTENLSELGATGSDAGALLPQGRRMVAVPIDRLTSVGYALQPGDRVDIIISLLFVDVDPEFQSITPNNIILLSVQVDGESRTITPVFAFNGRVENRTFPPPLGSTGSITQPQEDQRPRLVTQMTVQDALVMYVGTFPRDGRIFRSAAAVAATPAPVATTAGTPSPNQRPAGTTADVPTPTAAPPDIVALAVSPQEAVILTYFIESKIPITFALRPANEVGTQNVAQVNLEYIMNQYRIALPRRLDYTVEPAIRSIRQIIAGNTIQLRDEASRTTTGTPTGNTTSNNP